MSSRRRHGGNFTDSLNSFRQTFHSHADSTCSTYKTISQDSLDVTSNNNKSMMMNSIILAGNFVPKAVNASVLRYESDLCKNVDKQCYQMSEPMVEPNPSSEAPLKQDIMLNTAICMSLENHNMGKPVSSILNKDATPACDLKAIEDNKDFDRNQVKDPGKSALPVGTSIMVTPRPKRNTLSQMHMMRKKINTEHQSNVSETRQGCNINDVQSKLGFGIEQLKSSTNEYCDCGDLTETRSNVCVAKSIAPNNIHDRIGDNVMDENSEDPHQTQHFQFAEVLSHMVNKLNIAQKITSPKQILKRLSVNFTASPKDFTERLITIIEESVTHSDSGTVNNSAVNLSRLTKEFRTMCKFIEDEPMPEWPPSPILSCSSNFVHSTDSNNISVINEGNPEGITEQLKTPSTAQAPSTPSSYHTPESKSPLKPYKTPLNIFKSGHDNTSYMSFNTQNDTFEVLEAQCKIICFKEDQNIQPSSTALPQPVISNESPNMSMKKYLLRCEQQMASLDVSECDNPRMQSRMEIESPDKIIHRGSPRKVQTLQQQLMKKQFEQRNANNQHDSVSTPVGTLGSPVIAGSTSNSTPLRMSNKRDEVSKICQKSPSLHELEQSVLLGIAEKRQRCFDTAVAMMELHSNSKTAGAQETVGTPSETTTYCKANSSENSSKEFFNTLISCNKYFNYLEKHKTLINKVRSKELSICEYDRPKCDTETSIKESIEDAMTNMEVCPNEKESHRSQAVAPESSSTPLSSPLKQNLQKNQKKVGRPKLFTTPGKSAVNRYQKRKPMLLPTAYKASSFKNSPHTNTKKSETRGLHRFNYNTILSPVGMYIKGTDIQLIKNVQSKTNDMLLTPENAKDKSRKNSTQQCQSKTSTDMQENSLKFRLSPRSVMKPSEDINSKSYEMNLSSRNGNEIPDNQLTLPKVVYTLPAQVRTETKQGMVKNRVKGLLAAAQSKVVIRHEGRIGSAERKKAAGAGNGVHEILYGSTDESVQIESVAAKTNFICRKKL